MQIFIDLDGTLLDIKTKCYTVYTDLLQQSRIPVLSFDEYWTSKQYGVSEYQIVCKTASVEFAEKYIQRRPRKLEEMAYLMLDEVFDGVHEMLNLWRLKHQLYLVTLRRSITNLDRQLDLFDLEKYFKSVLVASTKKEFVLEPEILVSAQAVMVGDTEVDVSAGKNLGMRTVALTTGIRGEDFLQELEPDIIVSSFKEIVL